MSNNIVNHHNANNSSIVVTAQSSEMDYITSIQVAEVTGKQHSNVLRDIRNLLEQVEDRAAFNFELGVYLDANSQERPCYYLTKKDSLLLASGYNANLRAAIINRWEQLEQEKRTGGFQVPQSFSEALMLAASQAKQIEEQQLKIKADAPKVLFADAVTTSQRSCLVAELAKILQQNGVNIGQNRLFTWMRDNGYLCSKGQYYNQPTQKAMELGLFEIKQTSITKPDGSVLVTSTTKVTGKGQVYFVDKFLSKAN